MILAIALSTYLQAAIVGGALATIGIKKLYLAALALL